MIVSFKTLDKMRSYLTWSSYLALWTILSLRQTIGAIAIVLICSPCIDHNCKDGRISGGLFWLLSSVVSQKLSGTFKCARNDLFKCYQTIGTPRHIGRSKDFHKVRYFCGIWQIEQVRIEMMWWWMNQFIQRPYWQFNTIHKPVLPHSIREQIHKIHLWWE